MENNRSSWGSNLGFLLAAIGSAVGLGNIWGFPYKMGKSGGFTDERFLEVKSTINRDKKEVTISSQFQLFPPEKPLNLVLCVFEPAILSGISIDGLLQDFSRLGWQTND